MGKSKLDLSQITFDENDEGSQLLRKAGAGGKEAFMQELERQVGIEAVKLEQEAAVELYKESLLKRIKLKPLVAPIDTACALWSVRNL